MFSFFRKCSRNQKIILLTCFFAFFCNGNYSLVLGSVMPDLKNAWHLSDTFSGILLSAHSAGNLIAGFIAGLVPLALGERKSIMMLSILSYLGLIMMLISGNPVWLFLAFLMTGMGRGSVTNFDNRIINQVTNGSPAATNVLHSCFAVGAILAPQIFLFLSGRFSWRLGLAPIIILGFISFFNLSRLKLDREYPDRKDKQNRTMVFLKNPSFLILIGMMFCYLCSEYAINGWLVTYIQNKPELLESFAASGTDVSSAITAYSQTMATLLWGIMLVGRLLCAFLSSRISQKTLMMVSSFGVVLFFALMLSGKTVPMVTVAVAGLGLCMAGICPMIYSDAAIFTNTYPMATSSLLAIGSAGAILMPTVVGSLADTFGFTGGMSAIMVSVVLLAVFALLNRVVPTRTPGN